MAIFSVMFVCFEVAAAVVFRLVVYTCKVDRLDPPQKLPNVVINDAMRQHLTYILLDKCLLHVSV
jgi:hypothetical protein